MTKAGFVFSPLMKAIIMIWDSEALQRSIGRLSTHASIMAEPAFAAMVFVTIYRETVTIENQELPRSYMEYDLIHAGFEGAAN